MRRVGYIHVYSWGIRIIIKFSRQVFFFKVMTVIFLSRLLVKLQELNYNLKVKVSFDK